MKRLSLAVLPNVTLVCLLFSLPSYADLATVSLDWSKLKIETFGISGGAAPKATLSGQNTSLSGNAFDQADGNESFADSHFNWTDSRSNAAHTNRADASGSVSSSQVSASASSTAPDFFCCSSSGSVSRFASLDIDGPGTVLVSIPYAYSLSALSANQSSSIHIDGAAFLSSFFSDGSETSSGSRSIDWSSFMGPASTSGTLLFGLVTATGGSGSLSLNISASTGFGGFFVPEPSVVLELIAGLGALVVVGYRRVANVKEKLS